MRSGSFLDYGKAFSLGEKVARNAPDEGEMSGSYPPHQSPAVTASPKGGSHTCGLPVHFALSFCCGRGIPRPCCAL